MSPLPNAIEVSKAKAANRAPRLPEIGGVLPLPEYALALVPESVAEASAQFAAALGRLDEAHATARAAADAVEASAWEDRQAAKAAAAVGKQPPKATVGKAQEEADRAARAVPASESLAREALDAYLKAVRKDHDAIDANAQDRESAMAAELKRKVDDLAAGLLALAGVRNLRRELIPGATEGRHPSFSPRLPRRLPAKLIDPLESIRSQLDT